MALCEAQGLGPQGVAGRENLVHYVYFLRSLNRPTKTYVGHTEDIHARIEVHNAGSVPSTSRFRPWELMAYIAVRDEPTAIELERYFKSGSGHAFWHKRFMP